MDIGQKIKIVRELKNLKQEYMAEQLGITQSAYSKLEHVGNKIVYSKLEKIARIFDMNPEQIINFDEKSLFHITENNRIYPDRSKSDETTFYKEEALKKDMLIQKLSNQISSLKKQNKKRRN